MQRNREKKNNVYAIFTSIENELRIVEYFLRLN